MFYQITIVSSACGFVISIVYMKILITYHIMEIGKLYMEFESL